MKPAQSFEFPHKVFFDNEDSLQGFTGQTMMFSVSEVIGATISKLSLTDCVSNPAVELFHVISRPANSTEFVSQELPLTQLSDFTLPENTAILEITPKGDEEVSVSFKLKLTLPSTTIIPFQPKYTKHAKDLTNCLTTLLCSVNPHLADKEEFKTIFERFSPSASTSTPHSFVFHCEDGDVHAHAPIVHARCDAAKGKDNMSLPLPLRWAFPLVVYIYSSRLKYISKPDLLAKHLSEGDVADNLAPAFLVQAAPLASSVTVLGNILGCKALHKKGYEALKARVFGGTFSPELLLWLLPHGELSPVEMRLAAFHLRSSANQLLKGEVLSAMPRPMLDMLAMELLRHGAPQMRADAAASKPVPGSLVRIRKNLRTPLLGWGHASPAEEGDVVRYDDPFVLIRLRGPGNRKWMCHERELDIIRSVGKQ